MELPSSVGVVGLIDPRVVPEHKALNVNSRALNQSCRWRDTRRVPVPVYRPEYSVHVAAGACAVIAVPGSDECKGVVAALPAVGIGSSTVIERICRGTVLGGPIDHRNVVKLDECWCSVYTAGNLYVSFEEGPG